MTPLALRRFIGWGLTLLVAVIPFHAILVISLGHVTGHQAVWAAWKEVLLVILAAATAWLAATSSQTRAQFKHPAVVAGAVFVVTAAIVTLAARPSLAAVAFGAKTSFEFLVAGAIGLAVATPQLVTRLVKVLLASTVLVVAFGLLQAYILPHNFLEHLGYGFAPGATVPYSTVLAGDVLHYRYSSTLGGPNQLGTFLILPLALSLILGRRNWRWWLLSLGIIHVIFLTYSRSAWIGATLATGLVAIYVLPRRARLIGLAGAGALLAAIAAFTLAMPAASPIDEYLLHPGAPGSERSSDTEHLSSLQNGLTAVLGQPFGHGLGTAGPATFHTGTINIIENYYLQIGYETGLIGLAAFAATVGLVIWGLCGRPSGTARLGAAAAIAGISVTALLLPAWTDSSTALSVWIIAGSSLGLKYVASDTLA